MKKISHSPSVSFCVDMCIHLNYFIQGCSEYKVGIFLKSLVTINAFLLTNMVIFNDANLVLDEYTYLVIYNIVVDNSKWFLNSPLPPNSIFRKIIWYNFFLANLIVQFNAESKRIFRINRNFFFLFLTYILWILTFFPLMHACIDFLKFLNKYIEFVYWSQCWFFYLLYKILY